LRNRVQNLLDYVRELGVHVEISDGVIELSRTDKLRWIERFAKHVEVFSEVGGKIVRQKLEWNKAIAEELAAGSRKVVIEGREIGPVGVKSEADVRHDFVEMLVAESDPSNLVFEAFERRQQVWLIKRFGPNVNLGNIPPTDLLTVESFRQGLKEHTLLHTFERRLNDK
jgi:phosphosulfolactate synthase